MKKYYPIQMDILKFRKFLFYKGKLQIVITLPLERLEEAYELANKIKTFFRVKKEL